MKNIILLHGAIGAADQLTALKEKLSEENLNVYTFNFSGHGKQSFKENFTIEAFALELEEFISSHNFVQPNIFGYSMGGFVALYLASTKPDLLGSIMTLGTKFEWSPEIAQQEIKMLNANTIKNKVPKFAETLKERHGENWEKLLEKTSDMMLQLGNNPLLNSAKLSEIKNKILIGIADKDVMVSLEETTRAYKALTNASMFMLPNSKHPIESINLTVLAFTIKNFIE